MKKSHKREIFMARLIFGAFVLLVVLLIVAVILIVSGLKSGNETQKPVNNVTGQLSNTGTENISQEPSTEQETTNPPATENTENSESESSENPDVTVDDNLRWIKGDNVNFRSEPNTDCEILGSFAGGTEVQYISESDGWAKILYNGKEGYVKTDFLTDVKPE